MFFLTYLLTYLMPTSWVFCFFTYQVPSGPVVSRVAQFLQASSTPDYEYSRLTVEYRILPQSRSAFNSHPLPPYLRLKMLEIQDPHTSRYPDNVAWLSRGRHTCCSAREAMQTDAGRPFVQLVMWLTSDQADSMWRMLYPPSHHRSMWPQLTHFTVLLPSPFRPYEVLTDHTQCNGCLADPATWPTIDCHLQLIQLDVGLNAANSDVGDEHWHRALKKALCINNI